LPFDSVCTVVVDSVVIVVRAMSILALIAVVFSVSGASVLLRVSSTMIA
jgi:hypothetical protein